MSGKSLLLSKKHHDNVDQDSSEVLFNQNPHLHSTKGRDSDAIKRPKVTNMRLALFFDALFGIMATIFALRLANIERDHVCSVLRYECGVNCDVIMATPIGDGKVVSFCEPQFTYNGSFALVADTEEELRRAKDDRACIRREQEPQPLSWLLNRILMYQYSGMMFFYIICVLWFQHLYVFLGNQSGSKQLKLIISCFIVAITTVLPAFGPLQNNGVILTTSGLLFVSGLLLVQSIFNNGLRPHLTNSELFFGQTSPFLRFLVCWLIALIVLVSGAISLSVISDKFAEQYKQMLEEGSRDNLQSRAAAQKENQSGAVSKSFIKSSGGKLTFRMIVRLKLMARRVRQRRAVFSGLSLTQKLDIVNYEDIIFQVSCCLL